MATRRRSDRSDQESETARPSETWLRSDWPKVLSLVGVLLYAFLWTATSAFYSRLGVDPQELGIDYGSILVKSAGAIVLVLILSIVLVLLTSRLRDRRRTEGSLSPTSRRTLVALGIGVLVWGVGLFVIAAVHANMARDGRVAPTSVGFLPYVPWRVWPAEVAAAEADPSSAVELLTRDCVFYLGTGNGKAFFYDVDQHRTIHVSTGAVVVSTQSRGERPTCPTSGGPGL
jgi:hypothetical protein